MIGPLTDYRLILVIVLIRALNVFSILDCRFLIKYFLK